MAVRSAGAGPPVLLLHGNPTSSYLWRTVIERIGPIASCLAPDLLGMGASGRLPDPGPGSYRYGEHLRHLDALLEVLIPDERVVLVGHDWGGVLATHWARRHSERVRGIAYLETLVAPVTWDSPNAPDPALFGALRSADGERLVLQENVFLEQVLAAGVLNSLSPTDLAVYRGPYVVPGEGRRPMLTWAREIPIDGEPPDVHDVVAANAEWMSTTPIPKLFIDGDPGALLTGPLRELAAAWPEQARVTVPGIRFLPEDSGAMIGEAINEWLRRLPR